MSEGLAFWVWTSVALLSVAFMNKFDTYCAVDAITEGDPSFVNVMWRGAFAGSAVMATINAATNQNRRPR